MWTLRSSPTSPFGRKVRIGADLCGLADRIAVENADTVDPQDTLLGQNPLGKVPTLMLEDGTAIYDSRVILDWLDAQAGGGIIVPTGPLRFQALVMQALADGILDANILIIYEGRFRPAEKHHQPWLDRQEEKVARSLRSLEADPPAQGGPRHVGHIALACALGHRDYRFGGKWRESCPRLAGWLDEFAATVPSYAASAPP